MNGSLSKIATGGMTLVYMLLVVLCCPLPSQVTGQDTTFFHPAYWQDMTWRNIGPFRGGRSNAVAGHTDLPYTYFMGGTGGGIWKTTDGGLSWKNVSDGYLRSGSVGALAIAPSDPNVVYAGMGEHAVRGVMTSHGDGLYKSTDQGRTWMHVGLPDARHIADIRIHPTDPELIYVAVQGALYGPSEDRGIFRSKDGGKSWEKVLFVNPSTGAADLSMNPQNPRILYAGMWDHQRTPWSIRSGGPGSGIYRSKDGGETWQPLTKGLPKAMGKVAVSVSPTNPDVVYANIEAEKGGVFRSDDGGESWTQTCSDRVTIARAWYYIEIEADPKDPETVYVLNAPMLKSIDGGKTFTPIPNPHTDQHDLWIDPQSSDRMILANDGGACITNNGGKTWSSQQNQPTAQFYRVITDRQFPYHIYAGQQDNSTVSIASRTTGAGIGPRDWHPVSGGESAFLAFDPDDPSLVYGNSIQGFTDVWDERTGVVRDIMAYPAMYLGTIPKNMKYRFNWNNPMIMDPHEPGRLLHGAQVVLESRDGGFSWQEISPDLTRNDTSRQGPGGTPYTNEAAGGENYNTLSYLAMSPIVKGVIWAGSDDGLIHLSRDNGQNWTNVTPPGLPEALINAIEPSPHAEGEAFVAVTRYKWNELDPIILHTADFGVTWNRIETDLPKGNFVRVVREDPKIAGLLYAGTEGGLYLSTDKGGSWHPFQLNLPICPITDLCIAENDLVAATSGRAFWILDDLSPIQEVASAGNSPDAPTLFPPADEVRYWSGTTGESPPGLGQNRKDGFMVSWYLPEVTDSMKIRLEVLDQQGEIIQSYTSEKQDHKAYPGGPPPPRILSAKKGLNRFAWDLRRATLPGMEQVFIFGNYKGHHVPPGTYGLRLTIGDATQEQSCTLFPDPRMAFEPKDYAAQDSFLQRLDHMYRSLAGLFERGRVTQRQLDDLQQRLSQIPGMDSLAAEALRLATEWRELEKKVIQPRQQTYQDVVNFESRLATEILALKDAVDSADPRITHGAEQRLDDLNRKYDLIASGCDRFVERVEAFNRACDEVRLPAIIIPKAKE